MKMSFIDFEYLERAFTTGKVMDDLCSFYGLSGDGIVQIYSAEYYGSSSQKVHDLSRADKVFVAAIRTLKQFDSSFFLPYLVEAIIGDFIVYDNGIVDFTKFKADISYGFDLEIKNVSFYH